MNRTGTLERLLAYARQQLIIADCPGERKWWQAQVDEYADMVRKELHLDLPEQPVLYLEKP